MPFVGDLSKPWDYNRLPYKVNCGLSRCLKDMSDMRFESPTRVADSDRKLHSVLCPPD